jgi:predicted transcriptional regulator
MMESAVLTLRLNADTKNKLDQLANATHRSKSFLAAEAINRYLELESWQISEIELSIKEADSADFASSEQLSKLANKYAG